MQNFDLLRELGQARKPVLLKRGMANTLKELLMSAEYVLAGGNPNVILCERGIRTFETYTRNTLDISAVPVLKELSHLPVIVDPSHACGLSRYVPPLALAETPVNWRLVMMLTTPAIASAPYDDESPSRRTSTRSMMSSGIVLRSTKLRVPSSASG